MNINIILYHCHNHYCDLFKYLAIFQNFQSINLYQSEAKENCLQLLLSILMLYHNRKFLQTIFFLFEND